MCTMRRNQQMTPLVLLWLSDLADVCSLLVSLCQPSSWICYNYVIVWYGDVSLTLSFVKFYWTMACFRIIKELSITCHQSLLYRSPSYTRQLDVWAKDWWEWDNLIVFLVKGFYYAKSTTAHNIGLLILTLSLVRVSLHMLFPVIDK